MPLCLLAKMRCIHSLVCSTWNTHHVATIAYSCSPSLPPSIPPSPSGREDRYSHEFVSDEDEEDGVVASDDTLQQSFANFSQVAPRFSQMIEEMQEMQSSLCDEPDPAHHLRGKMVPILAGEGPKHEHRDSGISGESATDTHTRGS